MDERKGGKPIFTPENIGDYVGDGVGAGGMEIPLVHNVLPMTTFSLQARRVSAPVPCVWIGEASDLGTRFGEFFLSPFSKSSPMELKKA
ncbi:hypothetical protein VNO77_03191 [Canavalia gladiata]|uniref:Uncharacterized protein n=1 Tax=Canavalia gladiata TaxID=3824 RepID=A0AAN9MZF5_CANGL